MHDTAYSTGKLFFDLYWKAGSKLIVELGAYDVNGSLRDFKPKGSEYVGLDIEAGPRVDVVIDPSQPLPFESQTADFVLSASVFEHDRFFWTSFAEMCRITRPGGFIYVQAPSNGPFHRYPRDYWRFYPDSGLALQDWGKSLGYDVYLVESFVADREEDFWNDFVAVFQIGAPLARPDDKFIHSFLRARNIHRFDVVEIMNETAEVEDLAVIAALRNREKDAAHLLDEAKYRISELEVQKSSLIAEQVNKAMISFKQAFTDSYHQKNEEYEFKIETILFELAASKLAFSEYITAQSRANELIKNELAAIRANDSSRKSFIRR